MDLKEPKVQTKVQSEADELLEQEVTELLDDELDSIWGSGLFCTCYKNSNCKQNT